MGITILAPAPAPVTRIQNIHDTVDERDDPALGRETDDEDVDMLDTADGARGGNQNRASSRTIVTPGELVTEDPQWMRGHGTTTDPANNTRITSTVAGTLTRTNKLLSVSALRTRYTPEIGDLVIGRIVSVGAKRWSVDIGAALLAALPLSSINLPGGVQRRRTAVDELNVRAFFAEADLLVAEVQAVRADGSAALHTRNTRYGKLRTGLFTAVAGAGGLAGGRGGVVRSKRALLHVDCRRGAGRVSVILGVNGFVWVQPYAEVGAGGGADGGAGDASYSRLEEAASFRMYSSENDAVAPATRREMHVLLGCVRALAERRVRVDEEMLLRVYQGVGEAEMDVAVEKGADADAEGVGFLGGEAGRRIVDAAVAEAAG